MKNNKYEKPSICIFCSSEIKDTSNFSDLFFGIEEEGIPYEIKRKKESDASKLSYRAAQESRLAVGIGIHKSGEIALTFNKLKKDEPLFSAHFNSGENILRNLGANAGRLVKGISFK